MHVAPDMVLAFLGREAEMGSTAWTQLQQHIDTTTAMVRAYTRGRGFDPVTQEPEDDVAAAIVSCTARQYANPTHEISMSIDDASAQHGKFNGWTLPELAILHRYRARAR